MKKTLSLTLTILMVLMSFALFSCEEGERYNLKKIQLSTVSLEHYEYNYIEFDHENGTYKLENKVKQNGIVTKQTGKFFVDEDNNVTFTNNEIPSQDFILYNGEKAYFSGNQFHVEAYISGYGNVYMIFAK